MGFICTVFHYKQLIHPHSNIYPLPVFCGSHGDYMILVKARLIHSRQEGNKLSIWPGFCLKFSVTFQKKLHRVRFKKTSIVPVQHHKSLHNSTWHYISKTIVQYRRNQEIKMQWTLSHVKTTYTYTTVLPLAPETRFEMSFDHTKTVWAQFRPVYPLIQNASQNQSMFSNIHFQVSYCLYSQPADYNLEFDLGTVK